MAPGESEGVYLSIAIQRFSQKKHIVSFSAGFDDSITNTVLFDWQRDIVRWALKKGRCAIFADCGLGKTGMQLEWAQRVSKHTGHPVLILAPLAVAKQTFREGVKFGIGVNVCRRQSDVLPGVNITNYEMLQHFSPSFFSGVVLDESSILKHKDSKTRILITESFSETPYKLCCTATLPPTISWSLGRIPSFLAS